MNELEAFSPQFAESFDSEKEPIDMEAHIRDYHEYFKENLIADAAEARDWAVSHRQPMFQVGCSVMTKPGTENSDYSIHTGHNSTPRPGLNRKGSEKRCAERMAAEKAITNDAELIVAMVTVSRETSTGDATKAHDALHPCPDCRAMLRSLLENGILREDSIMCNVNDSKKVNGRWAEEERTVKELLDMYKDEVAPRAA